jgi:hypothetical protein
MTGWAQRPGVRDGNNTGGGDAGRASARASLVEDHPR